MRVPRSDALVLREVGLLALRADQCEITDLGRLRRVVSFPRQGSSIVMKPPAVGIYLSQTTERDNLAQARLAEEVGLDAVWLSDVLMGPTRLEAVSLASAMLGATSRIRVGVNVVNTTTWY